MDATPTAPVSLRTIANDTTMLGIETSRIAALLFMRDDGQDATPEELAAIAELRAAVAKMEDLT